MDDDQQFCLRWNNHQSTLVSVFDTLLENGTLVDCTLAAEGKYLKAHKVVLSACSPYFESLLSQQYDKHPIFILKDVKFQELKAMMDYMYRGEVNISQDQLAALLKAAESLQIKGLSDSRGKNESEPRKAAPPPPPPPAKTPPPAPTIPRVQGLTIEQRKAPKLSSVESVEDARSREGSQSPLPRKRKKPRRRSHEGLIDNHDASNSSESHSNQTPAQNIPTSIPAIPLASTSKLSTDVPEPIESKSDIITRQKAQSLTPTNESDLPQVPTIREKLETHSELMLEPKSEYLDDDLMNEDSVEDLTLDDDDINNMEGMDHSKPGPSHGTAADGSAQGFSAWHMAGNQTQDEVFLAAQEAVGAHRDSQDKPDGKRKTVKIIAVENIKNKEIIGDLKKELSTHLSFDKVTKKVNKKIIDKEITLKRLEKNPRKPNIIIRKTSEIMDSGTEDVKYYARQSISQCRMEKFLSMTAADIPAPPVKQLACMNPILKTPKDTIRCTSCDVLYDPSKKVEHMKTCTKVKSKTLFYGCVQCSFKHSSKECVTQHIKEAHK